MDNRFFLIAAFFAIIYPLQHAKAQDSNDSLAFVSANWNWQEIGNGAKAGYAQFRIFGSTQSISIVKYPARKFRTQIINSPGNIANTTDSLAMKYASLVAINGSFFNTKTLYPHTFLSINHKIEGISSAHEYRRSNGILAFKDRKGRKMDIFLCDTSSYAKYSKKKQLEYKEQNYDPNEPIRLNKFLSNAGVCSRREADEFIQAGAVKVNGEVVTELGTKITRQDLVTYNDKPVQIESKVYIVLNKPKNCVTTSDDPQERLTVMDLVKNACKERIYPVGRLDRNTTGVLLLTNDGDLASKLTHPSFKKKKIYHVWLDKNVSVEDMEKIANGLDLEDGEIHADAISYASETDKSQVGIEIHSGRNRIVRRIFESLGYHVVKLDRVYFAGLTKKNLGRGKWRYLNEKEVNALRMGAFE